MDKIIMVFLKQTKIMKKLYRKKDSALGGVCSGLGHYFGIDPIIVRLIWLMTVLAFGVGVIAYIVAWIIIPEEK